MKFSTFIDTPNSSVRDFDFAKHILCCNGFTLIHADDKVMTLKGEGTTSTNQDPLKGATTISLEKDANKVTLTATLGGVAFLTYFVFFMLLIFPVGLLYILSGDLTAFTVSHGLMALLLFVSISYWLRYRTTRALKNLLTSMRSDAESKG